jgi:hypothetical protein
MPGWVPFSGRRGYVAGGKEVVLSLTDSGLLEASG